MDIGSGSAKNIKIAYIGGGSRGWAWGLMSDLFQEEALSGEIRLYDIDWNAASNNEKIGNTLSSRPNAKGMWKYRAVRKLDEALDGADFVIISILPGTFEEMAADVDLPQEYGIYQSVGDTVGPGGILRAMRTIPMYQVIAEASKRHCPRAWVINYTNPMSVCVGALYKTFPEIKAFGCCHEVFEVQKVLGEMTGEYLGIPAIPREDIKVNILGINHFTWFDRASYKGTDIFPVFREYAETHYKEGFATARNEHWMNSFFSCAHRVKFDLFKRYGLIAAAGDRHLAEFMYPWYLKNPETAAKWKFGLTPVSWRIENRKRLDGLAEKYAAGETEVPVQETGEEGVRQMKALLGLGELVTNVNVPNRGQMADLPPGSVVETNAYFSMDSIKPVIAGSLPGNVAALVCRHSMNQVNILDAAFERSLSKAFNVFVNDPLVRIDADQAWKLFSSMVECTRQYLPDWK